jgi:Uncharacterized protein conserved in bacteria
MAAAHTSKFAALLASKCPRCRVGKMFVGNTYGLRKQRMNDVCPHCGFRFEIEPGYFYAAMYVSYALNVAQVVTAGLVTYQLTKSESPWLYLGVLVGTILIFSPFNFRYSRLILLHYLTPRVKYDPRYEDESAS